MTEAPAGLPSASSNGNAFEKAYSLYRLHREEEASTVLGAMKEGEEEVDRGVLHLEAQLVRGPACSSTWFPAC